MDKLLSPHLGKLHRMVNHFSEKGAIVSINP